MKSYMTKPRKILLEFLKSNLHQEFSVGEIKKALNEQNISLSSIYRNLQFLEKQGLVKQVVGDKTNINEIHYQCVNSTDCMLHIHLVCEHCRSTIHMCEQEQNQIHEHILSSIDFHVNNNKTVIYGSCASCYKK